jgi:6-pyruvoyl-tetrahydropterin synthase
MSFEVGTAARFVAFHRQPVEGPEGELHPHAYRMEVVVGRDQLDGRGMVCDLELLNQAVREAASKVEGRDLEAVRPPEAQAVTVEVLARWAHDVLAEAVRLAGGETLSVRLYESDSEFGGYAGPVA